MRPALFLLQVLACPDTTWGVERGVFTLSHKKIEEAYYSIGLSEVATRRWNPTSTTSIP